MSNKKDKRLFKYFKRFFDILCALLGAIVLIFISIIIKLSMLLIGDKDTIFFYQERTGLNGKKFELIKFRSMKITNDVRDTSKEDEFTKIGLFIRKTSLDELPQVINILRGEMSFIGPRPWIPEYYEHMTKKQRKRVSVLPGITGLTQVNGRNGLSVIDKINYDLEYVNNYSFLQDLKIIIKTVKTIFSKEDTYTNKIEIQNEIEALKNQ